MHNSKCTRCGSTADKHVCSNLSIITGFPNHNIPEYSIMVTNLPDGGYRVEVLELPIKACIGTTVEEAVMVVRGYAIEWVEHIILSGLDTPKPFNLNMDQHNPNMRTICEVLREIHQSDVSDEIKSKALEAMIMAKKMDAKLRSYKKDYDTDGWWEHING